MDDQALLYGEPITDDEFLCNEHGCRLSARNGNLFCPECEQDAWQKESDIEIELSAAIENQTGNLDHGKCIFTHGNGVTAFHCTMPLWA